MAVTLRLSRIGKKHVPFFRIVAVDSRKKRDGECLAVLGTYDVLKTKLVNFDEQGIQAWIDKGARVSDSVKKIIKLNKQAQKAAAAAPKAKKEKAAPKKEASVKAEAKAETAPVQEEKAPKKVAEKKAETEQQPSEKK